MTELLIFILSCYGGANGIAFSRLLLPFRLWIEYSEIQYTSEGNFESGRVRDSRVAKFLTKLINCPLCLGFWLGIMFSLGIYSPCVDVPGIRVGFNLISLLFDGFLGSASAWILHLLLRSRMEGA